ncbi:NAD(P)H-dependent oxidoreductase [Flavobacterium sp. ASW18X]|uniref:NAD(P)H-dependent oxidoreductase n=1 Tax=Flavobacterium sp. ASW18X TaxID=2572595 RepID=UPI0010ADFBC9|nr:NAD(P)H-dependent oxidoreductase [Flavobacterium sp. ASW18X]TKD59142.1 NAD(P)H oxidoreductase [Flavobacterium sp. ASW18X]
MRKILVLFAHPKLEQSKANTTLVQEVMDLDGVTLHDLYQEYPDFNIHIEREKELLSVHDVVVWHHPFYWYSCPPLLKQWIDMVLEYNWAYGPKGKALWNKICFNTITTGGTRELYCATGNNHFTIREFLRPFEQTATLCGMEYLPPFALMGTHQLDPSEYADYAIKYKKLLQLIRDGEPSEELAESSFLNEHLKVI